jgi:hypothetical protein
VPHMNSTNNTITMTAKKSGKSHTIYTITDGEHTETRRSTTYAYTHVVVALDNIGWRVAGKTPAEDATFQVLSYHSRIDLAKKRKDDVSHSMRPVIVEIDSLDYRDSCILDFETAKAARLANR